MLKSSGSLLGGMTGSRVVLGVSGVIEVGASCRLTAAEKDCCDNRKRHAANETVFKKVGIFSALNFVTKMS